LITGLSSYWHDFTVSIYFRKSASVKKKISNTVGLRSWHGTSPGRYGTGTCNMNGNKKLFGTDNQKRGYKVVKIFLNIIYLLTKILLTNTRTNPVLVSAGWCRCGAKIETTAVCSYQSAKVKSLVIKKGCLCKHHNNTDHMKKTLFSVAFTVD
jgi:hypothetical protein